MPCWLNVKSPAVTNPMWLTEEYATSRFMSGCTRDMAAP